MNLGCLGVVAQNLSEFKYVGSQDLWLHVCLWPERIQQLIMRNQAARIFNEVAQNREGLTGKGDLHILVPEALVKSVQRKRLELLHAYGTPGKLNSTS